MVTRSNPVLDEVFLDAPPGNVNEPNRKKRRPVGKRTRPRLERDKVRQYAFRVLSQLSDLDAASRDRVLKLAAKLNKA